MNNLLQSREIPIGLGMAMAENIDAMQYFASLSDAKQRQIIEMTHSVRSKRQMQHFVQSMFQEL